jgi:hypothetical protein
MRQRMVLSARVLLIMIAIGAMAACASRSVRPGGPPPTSALVVVVGVVDSAPACPGPQRLDSPCPARPLSGAVVDITRDGRAITSIVADSSGRFAVHLTPGRYQFTAHNVGGLPAKTTQTVNVPTDRPVDLTVDSGIR